MKKKTTAIIIIILVFLITVAAAVVVTLLISGKFSPEEEKTEYRPSHSSSSSGGGTYCPDGTYVYGDLLDCPDIPADAKPIIYLYPEETISLNVSLGHPELLTASYPLYPETGWNVTASPDGTLTDNNTGRELYSLYWEGQGTANIEPDAPGFVVKGKDTATFLEEKLAFLGLNSREIEEFIIYWLPKLQDNEYNYIHFANDKAIDNYMPLSLSVQPDTIIRILMQWRPLTEENQVEEQQLTPKERKGFTVVEWGGTEL